MTATIVKRLPHTHADQALYTFNPRLEGHRHVVLSAIHNKWAHEVMAFPANPEGEITNYTELACIRDTTDHSELIQALGYEEQ